ncbi:MAG: hypothetical protein GYA51_18680 [Candidatus Methanofastidiosa archaeon]|jgi:hypothetical protein|nr:hypothetical protein [Candidatus Methanofastidiosa archaeon]
MTEALITITNENALYWGIIFYILSFIFLFFAVYIYLKTMKFYSSGVNYETMPNTGKLFFYILGTNIIIRVIGLVVLGLFFYFLGIGIICSALPFSYQAELAIIILPLLVSISISKIYSDKMQKASRVPGRRILRRD